MIDIAQITDGEDLDLRDSVVMKAGNVLSIQLGKLEYAPDFGVDYAYFLEAEFAIQNESFKAYLVQRLAESQVNVEQVRTTVQALFEEGEFDIAKSFQTTGLIL